MTRQSNLLGFLNSCRYYNVADETFGPDPAKDVTRLKLEVEFRQFLGIELIIAPARKEEILVPVETKTTTTVLVRKRLPPSFSSSDSDSSDTAVESKKSKKKFKKIGSGWWEKWRVMFQTQEKRGTAKVGAEGGGESRSEMVEGDDTEIGSTLFDAKRDKCQRTGENTR